MKSRTTQRKLGRYEKPGENIQPRQSVRCFGVVRNGPLSESISDLNAEITLFPHIGS
jgi:hypothetical protein